MALGARFLKELERNEGHHKKIFHWRLDYKRGGEREGENGSIQAVDVLVDVDRVLASDGCFLFLDHLYLP